MKKYYIFLENLIGISDCLYVFQNESLEDNFFIEKLNSSIDDYIYDALKILENKSLAVVKKDDENLREFCKLSMEDCQKVDFKEYCELRRDWENRRFK